MNVSQIYAAAVRAFQAQNFQEALAPAQELVKSDPRSGAYRQLLAAIYAQIGDIDSALLHIEKAVKGDQENIQFQLNFAALLLRAHKIPRSANAYRAALSLKPDAVAEADLAKVYGKIATEKIAAGNYVAAAEAFRAVIELASGAADYVLAMPRDPKIARRVYEELARRLPGSALATERLAFALFIDGAYDASADAFKRVANLISGNRADALFLHEVYAKGLCATATPPSQRRRLRFLSLMDVFRRVNSLEGAVAECGCFNGLSAYVMMSLTATHVPDFRGEGFHIFDSFEGLSEPALEDLAATDPNVRGSMKKGAFAADYDAVRGALATFPEATLYKGWIPDRFSEVADMKFKFLNLDVDLYQPTADSIRFFYPRLVPGGLIRVDDGNWPGCKKAILECASEFGYEPEFLEFNQAVISKPK